MIFFSVTGSVKFHWHSPFSLHLQLFLCKSISELLYCNKCSWNVVNTGHGQLRLLSNQTNTNCPGESSKDQLWKRWNVWGVEKNRVMLGLPGVSQQNWREGNALLLQVQLLCLMCACTCIQWVKTLAPQSLHFFSLGLYFQETCRWDICQLYYTFPCSRFFLTHQAVYSDFGSDILNCPF